MINAKLTQKSTANFLLPRYLPSFVYVLTFIPVGVVLNTVFKGVGIKVKLDSERNGKKRSNYTLKHRIMIFSNPNCDNVLK